MDSIARPATLLAGLFLTGITSPALAAIDTFTLDHKAGPCGEYRLPTNHMTWTGLRRIRIATGETIRVMLYGHGADFASDATGTAILEWLDGTGTTTTYPGAPIILGSTVPKGYVAVAIRAESQHGTGDRTVTVKWPTGIERIPLNVVSTCGQLQGATYRTLYTGPPPPPSTTPPILICTKKPTPTDPNPCN
jgi:hypothetical protein